MSLAKAAPDGLKDRECEKMALRERPPIPYVPEKDSVQETVSSFKDTTVKTTLASGTELRVPVWHSGTREAFLIHVGSARGAIEKKGFFKSFEELSKDYAEKRKKVKEIRKQAEALIEATAAQPRKAAPNETAEEDDDEAGTALLRKETRADLKLALAAVKEVADLRDEAAQGMFELYADLLSVDARYAWNKIVQEQTEADPYKDLHGLERKGPRGMSRKSFDDCVMFHLLTVFPNNAAEQERYYVTNVLKKPQRVSIRQFVQRVEQLNSYIAQLPCWYYSPSVNVKTVPMNVSFPEADLASHVLRMCPYAWQDQYNLHEKGGMPTDIRSLLQSLESIERVCGQEGNTKVNPSRDEKPSGSEKKGTKRPGTDNPRVPKKVRTERNCDLCKKDGGAYTTHNTRDCRRFEKDGTEKADFRAAKKGGKKPNPTKQSFAQLSEKLDKLEKVLKKKDTKKRKRRRSDSDSDSE